MCSVRCLGNKPKNEGTTGAPLDIIPKSACDVVKSLPIEFPGQSVTLPKEQLDSEWGVEGGTLGTGPVKISKCEESGAGAVTLSFEGTAEYKDGTVEAAGTEIPIPSLQLPWDISVSAELCKELGLPTGVHNFHEPKLPLGPLL